MQFVGQSQVKTLQKTVFMHINRSLKYQDPDMNLVWVHSSDFYHISINIAD